MYFSEFYSQPRHPAAPQHPVCAHPHADAHASTAITVSMEVRHAR